VGKFGSIDHVVNSAGVFSVKPFTEYTAEDFRGFVPTNLEGFIYITHAVVKQMLSQGTGGSLTSITASLAENPIAGVPASIPMISRGGTRRDYAEPRKRIREEQHPLQCGCARPGGHPSGQ
jgi:NAD(P)-dependent dehydrogenase (short-subunit alcohol dehydrogenase family)